MKHIKKLKAAGREWAFRLEILMRQVGIFFEELLGHKKNRDGGNFGLPPFAGKLAPIRPSPRSHLVAGKAMPPSDATYLWRKR